MPTAPRTPRARARANFNTLSTVGERLVELGIRLEVIEHTLDQLVETVVGTGERGGLVERINRHDILMEKQAGVLDRISTTLTALSDSKSFILRDADETHKAILAEVSALLSVTVKTNAVLEEHLRPDNLQHVTFALAFMKDPAKMFKWLGWIVALVFLIVQSGIIGAIIALFRGTP